MPPELVLSVTAGRPKKSILCTTERCVASRARVRPVGQRDDLMEIEHASMGWSDQMGLTLSSLYKAGPIRSI